MRFWHLLLLRQRACAGVTTHFVLTQYRRTCRNKSKKWQLFYQVLYIYALLKLKMKSKHVDHS